MTENINIGDRSLLKSIENNNSVNNRSFVNSKIFPIKNPYQKNKHFKDIVYFSKIQPISFTKNRNSNSIIPRIDKNNSYSINGYDQINRSCRNNIIGAILRRGRGSPDSSQFLSKNNLTNLNKENKINIFNRSQESVKEEDIISIDKYLSIKSDTMGKYKIDAKNKEDGISNNNLSINSSILHNSISKDKSLNDIGNIQVNIREKSFLSPKDSINIINTNKFIYDNISGSLHDIQKIYYNKTIKSIEHYNKWIKKMKKFRVSSLAPKNLETLLNKNSSSVLSEVVNEDPEKEKEQEEEDLFANFRDDYMEKKIEKEKEKQKNLQLKKEKEDLKMKNRLLKIDEYELYASYKYSYKNFPEGREQFSFRFNSVDVVLFGGLLMNKNNNYIWTLDPSNFLLLFF